jgi:hypothetical protein
MFPNLAVLGSKVGFLEALDRAVHLYLEVLKAQEPGERSGRYTGGTLVCRGIYENLPVSSRWLVVLTIYHSTVSLTVAGYYLLLAILYF